MGHLEKNFAFPIARGNSRFEGMKNAILSMAISALACACAFGAGAQPLPEARAQSENPGAYKNSSSGARIKNVLLNNSVFWSRLGWPYNPPLADESGKTRMMLFDDSPERKFHRDFMDAGVKIHSTILFSGWIAPGKYDYSATDKALAKAWKQPDISRGNVKLPTPMRRELHWKSHADFFRASDEDKICIDYEKFCGEANVRAIDYFSKIVKEESGKAAGAFYGYYLFVPRAAYNGHVEFDALLKSPNVDFLASPKGYRNVAPGESGMEQTPPMSINLDKIFIDELDVRTHLSLWPDAKDMAGTRTMLWREFAKCMQSRSGFWWMDLHGGWFDSPEIMREIEKIEAAARQIRAKSPERTAEVLIVSDNESFLYSKPSWQLHRDLVVDTISRIRMAGVPADHYRLADLERIDLSGYKAAVFINCVRITDERWAKISPRLRPDAALVWHHAPAVWGEKYDPARSEKITGFKLAERKTSKIETVEFADGSGKKLSKDFSAPSSHNPLEKPYPTFAADASGGAEVLAKYSDGSAAFAKISAGGRDSYFVSLPVLDSGSYRKIFDAAGIASPAPEGCAVYADSRLCGIFPKNAVKFKLSLSGEFCDAITQKTLKNGDEISIPAKGALVLVPKERGAADK